MHQGLCCVLGTHDYDRNCPCPDEAYNSVSQNKQRRKYKKYVITSSAKCYVEKKKNVLENAKNNMGAPIHEGASHTKQRGTGVVQVEESACRSPQGGKTWLPSWK